MRARRGWIVCLVLLGAAACAAAAGPDREGARYQGKVVLKATFSSTPGTLYVLSGKILFEALDRSESREWPYDAIRYLAWKGPGKVELKSRERDAKVFGKQKTYTFLVEEPPFPQEVADWVNDQAAKGEGAPGGAEGILPAVISWPVVRSAEHDHSFGSCSGSLVLSPESIDYKPRDSDHAVHLSYMDIREISRKSPFHLKLSTFKKSAKKFWFSEDLEFRITDQEIPDAVFQYMLRKVQENAAEEK